MKCFMFDLDQLTQIGCDVSLEEEGMWTVAHIKLPDGSAIKSPTEEGKVILYSWYEPSQDAINKLFAIGAVAEKFDDVSF